MEEENGQPASKHYRRLEKRAHASETESPPPPLPLYPLSDTRRRRAEEILTAAVELLATLGVRTELACGKVTLILPAGQTPKVRVADVVRVSFEDSKAGDALLNDMVCPAGDLIAAVTGLLVDSGVRDEPLLAVQDIFRTQAADGEAELKPGQLSRMISKVIKPSSP